MSESSAGKGDSPRPLPVGKVEYDRRFKVAFPNIEEEDDNEETADDHPVVRRTPR